MSDVLAAATTGLVDGLGLVRAHIDRAHAAGYAVPQAAADACQTLAALAVAWGHNAQGQPAPLWTKAQLGLPAVPSPAPSPEAAP